MTGLSSLLPVIPAGPVCPKCGRPIRITKGGLIGKHNERGYGRRWVATCSASGTRAEQ